VVCCADRQHAKKYQFRILMETQSIVRDELDLIVGFFAAFPEQDSAKPGPAFDDHEGASMVLPRTRPIAVESRSHEARSASSFLLPAAVSL
jgi:hypothetical protein